MFLHPRSLPAEDPAEAGAAARVDGGAEESVTSSSEDGSSLERDEVCRVSVILL